MLALGVDGFYVGLANLAMLGGYQAAIAYEDPQSRHALLKLRRVL